MDKTYKYAFITGASGEIGQAIARRLAKDGFHLYLHYHKNFESIKEIMAEFANSQVDIFPIQADFRNPESLINIVDSIFQLDVFVHAAGESEYTLFMDSSDASLKHLYQIHVEMPLRLVRTFLPKIQKSECGKILFISSIWGEVGAAMEVVYSTMKGAQLAFVKALSKEIAYTGTTVNAITPGAVDTTMLERFSESEKADLKQEIPLGRLATPVDVANAASYLLSDENNYITGQTLGVNGGWNM
ncbi:MULTISPECIES: elongation factor P 5-aminopentanone reductase [Listeria]|uniref:elongation factor P 5-aminopentanone reductase n=1 Tax=Listeria TaxID=1637 RepID=UPI000B589BB9|nr:MULTISPECIES: SDR family oxidoreductase [Listeria]